MKPAFKQYSVNESYSPSWDPRIQKFIEDKKTGGENPIPQRYSITWLVLHDYYMIEFYESYKV